jgi:hypothetical protein
MHVENLKRDDSDNRQPEEPREKPPGQFVTDELKAQTERFLEQVRGLAQRRRERATEGRPGPPPPDSQRSSRR